jgi:hypothetical protein
MAKDSKDSYMGWDITGVVSENKLLDWESKNKDIAFQGVKSGRVWNNPIIEVESRSWGDNAVVFTDYDAKGGDRSRWWRRPASARERMTSSEREDFSTGGLESFIDLEGSTDHDGRNGRKELCGCFVYRRLSFAGYDPRY